MTAVRSETLAVFAAVAVVALAVTRERRAVAVRLAAGLVGMVLVTGLWAWRNERVVGSPVLTTLNVGETLYDGFWSGADGGSDKRFLHDIQTSEAWKQMGTDEVARDRWLRRTALEYARAHPGRALRLAASKVARTWSPAPNTGPTAARAISAAAFIALVTLGLVGCVRARRQWRTWIVWAVPVVAVTAIHLVIVGSIRYRIPAMPFFVVMAGAALAGRKGIG